MKAFLVHLSEPLKSIKCQPYHFVVWWLVANVLGLAGIWLPLMILYFSDRPVSTVYIVLEKIINAGALSSFCVVILAEGITSNLVARKTESSTTAVGIRALFTIIALILIFIPVSIMISQHVSETYSQVSINFQIIVAGIAILLASYLYCFRFPAWGEKDVDSIRDEEDNEIRELTEKAEFQNQDDTGMKL